MVETVMVTVNGIRPDNDEPAYYEMVALMSRRALKNLVLQTVGAMGGFIPQIEDPDHPLNGLQIMGFMVEIPEKDIQDRWPSIHPDYWEVTEVDLDDE